MTGADLRTIAAARFVAIEGPISLTAKEIANLLFQRACDGLATTADDLAATGLWSRDVIARELPAAERIARQQALSYGGA